ncbi:MAG: zinc ribbon domain-containing protein [Actinomycetota bacterium]
MFCPNCGAENKSEQNFCRSCGLKLDAISQVVAEQFPTKEYAEFQKRKELFEKLGIFSISSFGLIGIAFLLALVGYYKMILFGADVIFLSGLAAFMVFGLLSVFFFNYPKLFMKFDKINPRLSPIEQEKISTPTNKLIEDKPFEPVPSVTENSTELLHIERKTRK